MSEIRGTAMNVPPLPEQEPSRNGKYRLAWHFDIEWGEGKDYTCRNVVLRGENLVGALRSNTIIDITDNGVNPIVVNDIHVEEMDAIISNRIANFAPDAQEEIVSGELRYFWLRHESTSPNPIWDMELERGGDDHVLVEFRSSKHWDSTISLNHKIVATGRRSTGNVLLANKLEDQTNHVTIQRVPKSIHVMAKALAAFFAYALLCFGIWIGRWELFYHSYVGWPRWKVPEFLISLSAVWILYGVLFVVACLSVAGWVHAGFAKRKKLY